MGIGISGRVGSGIKHDKYLWLCYLAAVLTYVLTFVLFFIQIIEVFDLDDGADLEALTLLEWSIAHA